MISFLVMQPPVVMQCENYLGKKAPTSDDNQVKGTNTKAREILFSVRSTVCFKFLTFISQKTRKFDYKCSKLIVGRIFAVTEVETKHHSEAVR